MKPAATTFETPAPVRSASSRLWQVEIRSRPGFVDRLAHRVQGDAAHAQWPGPLSIRSARGFLIQSNSTAESIRQGVTRVLVDAIVEDYRLGRCGELDSAGVAAPQSAMIHVLLKPGVTDPEAETASGALRDAGLQIEAVRTYRKYWVEGLDAAQQQDVARRFLANDSIETVVFGELTLERLELGSDYELQLQHVPLRGADDAQLQQINQSGHLSLTLREMQAIQSHFRELDREPSDIELETIAQTWSEHCSHKTLAGPIDYRDELGTRAFDNMLKETIFAATAAIRSALGSADWCVSVFRDNAGIVQFDDQTHVAFKVETHNRPSALEPYGGANTGVGGVIRDILGTGLGAQPICNTDVFCFAPPDVPARELPTGVLHPRRIMGGVVAGVRDYGNRMGIPTVNGAVYFDRRYTGNPLVFCGNVGLVPPGMAEKQAQPGDLIVTVGGRTGRDGIHGATFSSAELHDRSEQTSGGAVQIGNAITEKMLMDVLLQARDRGLYNAVTDCGAGGYSSAVGEMAEEIGAEVWLDRVPLKYRGLSYTEIWISEAQERMVLAVPPDHWDELQTLCEREDVEACAIGQFVPTGRLQLKYGETVVSDLAMAFLHEGRPRERRPATFLPTLPQPNTWSNVRLSPRDVLLKILGSWNVASKHWIIRQYDHEVQAMSVIKPLVGADNDGPSDAAVLKPRFDSHRGVVIACGMNPHYGDLDPYHMAASAIDEAVRNCVAVGADPRRIAILDNFCWGRTDRPETLGALVRAAQGCHDLAIALGTPFISGKDSLHNEFRYRTAEGGEQTIAIPSTLLISALGQIEDVRRCVTMDFKHPGNAIYLVGMTGEHLGGSHFNLVSGATGGHVPTVDGSRARRLFDQMHSAIQRGLVRSCHDLSEGGLAVALAEMAFAGGWGARVDLAAIPLADNGVPSDAATGNWIRLYSESNSRFLVEIEPDHEAAWLAWMADLPVCRLGKVQREPELQIDDSGREILTASIAELKQAWLAPLDWE